MKLRSFFCSKAALALTLLGLGLPAYAASSKGPGRTAAASTNTAAGLTSIASVEIPQSVFAIPSTPREGRNPFFPQSTFRVPVPIKTTSAIDTSSFVLNGITSPPKRTAMINGRTFETGESGEVRMPGGAKVLIKCEEIGADSAIIFANGQRMELHLRSGI